MNKDGEVNYNHLESRHDFLEYISFNTSFVFVVLREGQRFATWDALNFHGSMNHFSKLGGNIVHVWFCIFLIVTIACWIQCFRSDWQDHFVCLNKYIITSSLSVIVYPPQTCDGRQSRQMVGGESERN